MLYKRLFIIIIPLVLFLFAPNFSIQFISLIFSTVFLLSFLYSLTCRASLKADRITSIQRTYQNDPLEIRISIRNRGLFPLHQVMIYDNHGGLQTNGGEKKLLSAIRFLSKIDFKYMVSGTRRGEYTIGPMVVKGADPIGLFPWKKEFKETGKVIIYPGVFTPDIKDDRGLPCGSIKIDNPVFEDITQYKSIREYMPGDDLRKINWKVSARMGNLYTMQYMPSLHYSGIILLNLRLEDYPIKFRYTYIESAIETAASLVYHCIHQKQEASLVTTGILDNEQRIINFPLRKDENHAVQILEVLAKISPAKETDDIFNILIKPGMSIPWGCRVMYVGTPPTEHQLHTLLLLKNRGINPELFFVTGKRIKTDFKMPVYYTDNLSNP